MSSECVSQWKTVKHEEEQEIEQNIEYLNFFVFSTSKFLDTDGFAASKTFVYSCICVPQGVFILGFRVPESSVSSS